MKFKSSLGTCDKTVYSPRCDWKAPFHRRVYFNRVLVCAVALGNVERSSELSDKRWRNERYAQAPQSLIAFLCYVLLYVFPNISEYIACLTVASPATIADERARSLQQKHVAAQVASHILLYQLRCSLVLYSVPPGRIMTTSSIVLQSHFLYSPHVPSWSMQRWTETAVGVDLSRLRRSEHRSTANSRPCSSWTILFTKVGRGRRLIPSMQYFSDIANHQSKKSAAVPGWLHKCLFLNDVLLVSR